MALLEGMFRTPGIFPEAPAADPYLTGTQGTMLERRDARKRMAQTNPLSAFGFMTAQERAQGAALAAAQEQAQAMQLAQLSPLQMPVYQAHLAGNRIARAINSKLNPAQKNDSLGDDPEVAMFNELVAKFDGDVNAAMLEMGKELVKKGDARGIQMIQTARERLLEEEKELANIDQSRSAAMSSKATAAMSRTGAKLGDVREVINGESKTQQEVVGIDPETGAPIWRDIGTGPRSPTQRVQNLEDPRTATQKGSQYQHMIDRATFLKGAVEEIDFIIKTAMETPGAIGMQGAVIGKAADIYHAVRHGINTGFINKTSSPQLDAKMKNVEGHLQDFDVSGLEKAGIVNPQVQAQFVRLAYGLAAASEQGGRTISDRDVNFWMRSIGAGLSDPRALAQLLERTKYTLSRDYLNGVEFNNMQDVAPAQDYFRQIRDAYDPDGKKGSTSAPTSGGLTPQQKARLEELRRKRDAAK